MATQRKVSKLKLCATSPQVKNHNQYHDRKLNSVSPSSYVKSSIRKPTKNCKVSVQNAGISCQNRFQIVQCDDVIDSAPDIDTDAVQITPAFPTRGTTSQPKPNYTSVDDTLDDSIALSDNHKDISSALIKYDIPLRVSSKTQNYKAVLPNCPTLKLWDVNS